MSNVYNDLPKDVKNTVNDMVYERPNDADKLNSIIGMGIEDDFEQFYQTHIYPRLSIEADAGKKWYRISSSSKIYRAIVDVYGYKNFQIKLQEKGLQVHYAIADILCCGCDAICNRGLDIIVEWE